MKKLLVLALSAVLVFAMASMSMAAVAVTGEANFGLTIAPATSVTQFSDCKLVFDAAVNDVVSVNAAVKATNDLMYVGLFDTYSASVKMASGTLKIGYFGTNFNGKTDILGKKIGDLKGAANVNYSAPFGDAITAQIQYSYQTNDEITGDVKIPAAYLVGVKYATDVLGVEVGMVSKQLTDTATENTSGTALNFNYNVGDALVAYLNYESFGDDNKDEIVGVVYTSGNLAARFEYDLVKDADDNSSMGIGLAYTVDAIAYKLINVSVGGVSTTTVKATVKF